MTHDQEQLIIDLIEQDIKKHSVEAHFPMVQVYVDGRVEDLKETLNAFHKLKAAPTTSEAREDNQGLPDGGRLHSLEQRLERLAEKGYIRLLFETFGWSANFGSEYKGFTKVECKATPSEALTALESKLNGKDEG